MWCIRPMRRGSGLMADADALAMLAIARRDLQAAQGMTSATDAFRLG